MLNTKNFETPHYQRHNRRRQEHLASLMLPIAGKTVLEVGAGPGDHTSFFIDRGCAVTCTDARKNLLDILQARHGNVASHVWNLENPPPSGIPKHQIVYAYGILYHTRDPEVVLGYLSSLCTELLLLETCVSCGDDESINITGEAIDDPTQAVGGMGCRPTRPWVFRRLQNLFPYVYLTKTQPWHEEFPISWGSDKSGHKAELKRAIFIGARVPLNNVQLSMCLLDRQERC